MCTYETMRVYGECVYLCMCVCVCVCVVCVCVVVCVWYVCVWYVCVWYVCVLVEGGICVVCGLYQQRLHDNFIYIFVPSHPHTLTLHIITPHSTPHSTLHSTPAISFSLLRGLKDWLQ